jgi:alpha-beta hydrolase superfamily lysophospholipase
MPAPCIRSIEWKNSGATIRGSVHCVRPKGGVWCIFCHGFTGHRIGPGYLFVRLSRELQAAGVSSLRFDFRGSGESDGLFKDMTIDTMQSDLVSAVRLVRRQFAPACLLLLGHSLGGMIAALLCGNLKANGLALLAPVGEPQGLVKRRAHIIKAGPNSGGSYENGPHEMSLSFVDGLNGINPPGALAARFRGSLLLLQGDEDPSIAVAESYRYVEAARCAGIETGYYILKGADHNFSTVSHFSEVSRRVTAWAKEFLR